MRRMIHVAIVVGVCLTLALPSQWAEAGKKKKFSEIKGGALKPVISLYEGTPPPEYHYQSLGMVTGVYKAKWPEMAVEVLVHAWEELAEKADAMGANAVINVDLNPTGYGKMRYEGEAVIFEVFPPEE